MQRKHAASKAVGRPRVAAKTPAKTAAKTTGKPKLVPKAVGGFTEVTRSARIPRTAKERKARAAEYYRRLIAAYPNAHCALDHTNPYQLLVATILSAQCTDKRVNMVTPALFEHYPNATKLSEAKQESLEEEIKSTGFFRAKSKSLLGMARALVDRHGGNVPDTMETLTKLPGVGRKTANVVLGNAFEKNIGIVVDTHVARLSNRLALTGESDPVKIEAALMPLFPSAQWTMLSHLLIEHGRQICIARAPRCEACMLNDICPSSRV
ncbi:MAG TPA: endonuclease III [Gemmatimonadaceae bacterium]